MKTRDLELIERRCRADVQIQSEYGTRSSVDERAGYYARILLAVLPVVKAAEGWRLGEVNAPPITLAEQALLRAIDEMHRKLEGL